MTPIQPQVWISRARPDEPCSPRPRAVDARVAAGEALPLAGVPFAVKDNIDVAGLATTAACPAFAYRARAHRPTVVERLRRGRRDAASARPTSTSSPPA